LTSKRGNFPLRSLLKKTGLPEEPIITFILPACSFCQ
jgi:hypothetical protein